MKNNIFISYADGNRDIVENLNGHLINFGLTTWVYSLNRTLAEDIWEEIEAQIKDSDLIIFIVSESSKQANGQKKELNLVLEKITPHANTNKILPIFIEGTNPSDFPETLSNKNGEFLNARNVKLVAHKIANTSFPQLFQKKIEAAWKYPVPGEWLEITKLDEYVQEYFDIGDKLYFRLISPMGLLECYSPKIEGLFWIAAENVSPSNDIETDKELEDHIPITFKVSRLFEKLIRN